MNNTESESLTTELLAILFGMAVWITLMGSDKSFLPECETVVVQHQHSEDVLTNTKRCK